MCVVILTAALVGLLPSAAGEWLVEVQFMYLLLSASVGWVALWLVITLAFGRVYCSTVCPLGTLIDFISHFTRRGRHYRYAPPMNALRYTVCGAVALSLVLGLTVVPALVAPESVYGNIMLTLLRPAVAWSKAMLGHPAARVVSAGVLGFVVGVVSLAVVGILAWKGGRTYCNTLCPVGALLSLVSRNAVVHIDINTDLCTQCRRCEYECKASCIDLKDHVVDMSRCVNCFNCLDVCENDAISYTSSRHRLSTPMMQRIKSQLRPEIPQPSLNIKKEISNHDETIS